MPNLPFVLDTMGSLAARSVDAAIGFVKNQNLVRRDDGPPSPPPVPGWGAAVLITTLIVFVSLIISYQYTIGDLIATLTMIETPLAEAVELDLGDEPDNTLLKEQKESLLESAPTVALIPVKPITSKLRTTLKHLRANAGRLSQWRGIVPAMLYSFLVAMVANALATVTPRFIGRDIVLRTFAAIFAARLHMSWTHAMISMPSELTWYQRFAPCSAYKQLWLPTLVANLAVYVSLYLTVGVALVFHRFGFFITDVNEATQSASFIKAAVGIASVLAFGVFTSLAIVLPAHATLVRVEASMLPDDQDTIVPFDRSFNGTVVPKVLGGSGAIGFVAAWKTFGWEARHRLVKVYVKNALVQTALLVAAAHVLLFEVWAIMGDDLQKYALRYREWAMQHQHSE